VKFNQAEQVEDPQLEALLLQAFTAARERA